MSAYDDPDRIVPRRQCEDFITDPARPIRCPDDATRFVDGRWRCSLHAVAREVADTLLGVNDQPEVD